LSGGSALAVRRWFRRDVVKPLDAVVGGRARLRVIVLLACVLGLDTADKSAVGASAVQLKAALGIGNAQLGLLTTVSTLVGALATLPAGSLADRVNRVRLLVGVLVLWGVAMIVSGAAGSYQMLLLSRLGLGVVIATASPVVASLVGDLFPGTERGRIYGYVLSGELIGAGLGLLVSGNVAQLLSWRWAFWILALPALVLAVAVRRLLPEPARGGASRLSRGANTIRSREQVAQSDGSGGDSPAQGSSDNGSSDEEHSQASVERIIRRRHVEPHEDLVLHRDPTRRSLWWAMKYVLSIRTNRVLILASGLGYFYLTGLQTFAVVFISDRFNVGSGLASILLLAVGLGAILGVLVSGRIADRLIARRHLGARPLVAGVSFLVAAGLFLPGLLTTSLIFAVPLLFLGAAGLGGANPPLDAGRLDLLPSGLWGRAEAVRTVLRSSLTAAAPLVFGWLSTQFGSPQTGTGVAHSGTGEGGQGLAQTFLIMLAALAVAGVLLLVWARVTYPRDVATAIASDRTDKS